MVTQRHAKRYKVNPVWKAEPVILRIELSFREINRKGVSAFSGRPKNK